MFSTSSNEVSFEVPQVAGTGHAFQREAGEPVNRSAL